MELKEKHIGLAITGSFRTFAKIEQEILKLKETGVILHLIILGNIQTMDLRFGSTGKLIGRITYITENDPILCIEDVEPIGLKAYLDILLTAPCAGNTLTKLASRITDIPVLMVAKVHLRNAKPLVTSVSTNDALGVSSEDTGELFNSENIYFVPFDQDGPIKKPSSMIARIGPIENVSKETLEGRQIQPVIQG